jgi:hypothetical protein
LSIERNYSTLIYLSLSLCLILKWQISTRNIVWYLLTTKKKFILPIISGVSFKKKETKKYEVTPHFTERVSNRKVFSKKQGDWVFVQRNALSSFYQNIVGTSHPNVDKEYSHS